eukprot:COSAG01_NODE_52505_length_346_cov_0.829960_1_plen_79_part_01
MVRCCLRVLGPVQVTARHQREPSDGGGVAGCDEGWQQLVAHVQVVPYGILLPEEQKHAVVSHCGQSTANCHMCGTRSGL